MPGTDDIYHRISSLETSHAGLAAGVNARLEGLAASHERIEVTQGVQHEQLRIHLDHAANRIEGRIDDLSGKLEESLKNQQKQEVALSGLNQESEARKWHIRTLWAAVLAGAAKFISDYTLSGGKHP